MGGFCHPIFLYVHALPYMFQCALGNGSCFLRPKVIVMHGYSHTPQVTDIAGHIISRREVNELHPCVPAVCQYKIVFHALSFFMGCLFRVWAVLCTATPLVFFHFGNGGIFSEPFHHMHHVVFGSNDCRMFVYRGHSCTFVAFYPFL